VKKYLLAGLLVWLPLAVTVWVLHAALGLLDLGRQGFMFPAKFLQMRSNRHVRSPLKDLVSSEHHKGRVVSPDLDVGPERN
jgi:uncharacterized membrane protein